MQGDNIEKRRGGNSAWDTRMNRNVITAEYLETLGVAWIGQHKRKSKNNTYTTGERDSDFIFDCGCDYPDTRYRSLVTPFSSFLVTSLKSEYQD